MDSNFWFKFKFKDYLADTRVLSLTARGLLMEIIIYMESNKTFFIKNDPELLVRLTGITTEQLTKCITEFKNFGTLDFAQNDAFEQIMVSRKIKKDLERSRINTENGKNGGNPKLKSEIRLTDSVNQNDNQNSNSISNSISNNKDGASFFENAEDRAKTEAKKQRSEKFDVFWEKFGKKTDRKKCEDKWKRLTEKEIEAALQKVDSYVASTPDVQYRKNPLTWLNGKCWDDEPVSATMLQKQGVVSEKIEHPNISGKQTSYGWLPPYSFYSEFEPIIGESESSYRRRAKIWANNQ